MAYVSMVVPWIVPFGEFNRQELIPPLLQYGYRFCQYCFMLTSCGSVLFDVFPHMMLSSSSESYENAFITAPKNVSILVCISYMKVVSDNASFPTSYCLSTLSSLLFRFSSCLCNLQSIFKLLLIINIYIHK